MAKDPAFLFYPGDWLGGTMGMTFEEKGAYLELLLFQFNNGKFTLAQAKQVLSICSASVFEKVLQKFDNDGTFYWKQKLQDEIERRRKFTESRRNNAKSNKSVSNNKKAYAKHMETENETKSVIDIIIGVGKYFVIINPDTAYKQIVKICGEDGFIEYFHQNKSTISNMSFVPKFMRDRNGKHFKDFNHLWNDFNLYIKNQFK